ncbi:MAG: T9SS type A sorting domain-containing protein [Bacteroidetes bacterium]|nr:T9SS type A sorting domain-containing protein [Bacteroidota bacterium]
MKTLFLFLTVFLCFYIPSFAQTNWVVYDTINSPLPNNTVYKVVSDNSGNIWAATFKGLAKFDGSNWTIYDSIPNTSYALKNLFALAYDEVNDFIYVSMPGLLIRFDGINWNTWNHQGYSNENVIDAQGNVWMALYSVGVGVFDGTSISYYNTFNSPIPSSLVADIEMDNNGDFWILAGDGLTHFDGTTWTIFDTSNTSLPSNAIYGVGTDQNNLLWVHGNLTQNSAFIYTYNGSTWTAFDTTICQPLNAFSFIESDALNKIWIGTYGEGLQMINGLNCSVYTDANSPLPTNYILDIHITNSQTMWIATQLSGLIKVDLPVGVSETPRDEVFGIHPNPASDKITITDFPGGIVRISNVLGVVVFSADFGSAGSVEIDINMLASGVYTVKTVTGNSKIIKL